MNILLDTHSFIWLDADPSKLSPTAATALRNRAARVLLSTASILEIVIKVNNRKLTLREPLIDILKRQQTAGVNVLPILLDHVLEVQSLPTPHRDPFDRILAAQAIVEGADLLTKDPIFAQYPVRVIW